MEAGRTHKVQHGFTLIELMITVAVVAILAMIALPSYQQYIIRANRSAAQSVMLDIANREHQFFIANRTYANKVQLEATGFVLTQEVSPHYTYDVVPNPGPPPTFTITFTPVSGTAQASDGALGLTSEGVKTPAEKWKR
jgi:type IV pilus assembly protein PilE